MGDERDDDPVGGADDSEWERGIDRPARDREAGTDPRRSVEATAAGEVP